MIRIIPLFLAFTMLVGSVGVTVNRHFCMGELKSLTLFGKGERCEMDRPTKPACPMHAQAETKKKGCCDDEHEFVKWDDSRQNSELQPLPTWVAPGPVPSPLAFSRPPLHPRTAALRAYQNYRPPPLVIDVPRRWQVFRL